MLQETPEEQGIWVKNSLISTIVADRLFEKNLYRHDGLMMAEKMPIDGCKQIAIICFNSGFSATVHDKQKRRDREDVEFRHSL
jgi:hypothetical protein